MKGRQDNKKNVGPFKTFRTFRGCHCMNLHNIYWKTSPYRCFAQQSLMYIVKVSPATPRIPLYSSHCCNTQSIESVVLRRSLQASAGGISMQGESASTAHIGKGLVQLPMKLREDWIKNLGFLFCPGLFYKWACLWSLHRKGRLRMLNYIDLHSRKRFQVHL